jgi:hypothetical protein
MLDGFTVVSAENAGTQQLTAIITLSIITEQARGFLLMIFI